MFDVTATSFMAQASSLVSFIMRPLAKYRYGVTLARYSIILEGSEQALSDFLIRKKSVKDVHIPMCKVKLMLLQVLVLL
ncbi:hypothetical protein SAMN05444128_3214 [Pontibacter indicus]|uniref:Uncharacterized protein n=1 Tax=Pontibacter indicus TaxID=1317125 RepID=A0A1R3XPW0_9BACT|nr:hypothetical protein SAMN05444128_3214 [Pontibacter indicus]